MTPAKNRRLSQEKFFELWDDLEREGFGQLYGPGVPEDPEPCADGGCAVCHRTLVTLPAVDATCEWCDRRKSKAIEEVYENRDDIREFMEAEMANLDPWKEPYPIELALRAGLICPDEHWVCADCLNEHWESK